MDPTMQAAGPPGVMPGGPPPLVAMLAGIAQQAQMGAGLAQQQAAQQAQQQQGLAMIAALTAKLSAQPDPAAMAAGSEPAQVVSPPVPQDAAAQPGGGY